MLWFGKGIVMRKLLILSAMILSLAGVIRGQATSLQPCNEAQIRVAEDMLGDYATLLAAGPADDFTVDDLLEFSKAFFTWRDQLWIDMPICEEAFNTTLFADAAASDNLATYAFELAGGPVESNPHVERLELASQTQESLLDDLSSTSAGRLESSGEFVSEPCAEEDWEILTTLLVEFNALMEIPPRMESAAGLSRYGVAQTGWRDSLWSRLPLCQWTLEAALLMSHISSDAGLLLALEVAGLSANATAISDRIAAGREQLSQLTESLADAVADVLTTPNQAVSLPPCSDQEEFRWILTEAMQRDLLQRIGEAATLEDLLNAAEEHLAWREVQDSSLPACAEIFEIAMLSYRAAGTYFTAHTLELIGLPREDNVHFQYLLRLEARMAEKSSVITGKLTDAIVESMDEVESDEETEATPVPERSLPACESKKLGTQFFNAMVDYTDVTDRVDLVENVGDVLAIFDLAIAWTETYFEALPKCAEALEATLLMYRVVADYSASFALLVAGVDFADIPYVEVIYENEALLEVWLENFVR